MQYIRLRHEAWIGCNGDISPLLMPEPNFLSLSSYWSMEQHLMPPGLVSQASSSPINLVKLNYFPLKDILSFTPSYLFHLQ